MYEVSENTQAILLLTAPLTKSKQADSPKILSLQDYNTLARSLRSAGLQPRDLLGSDLDTILENLPAKLDKNRIQHLLNRGFLLGQALADWRKRAIWVVSRADKSYPRRLKDKLREQAPSVIYGCGEISILDRGGLAVIGSRNITDDIKCYTEKIGALAAESDVSIVSGAARGIDSSAMSGALTNGGRVIGVMADSLAQAVVAKKNREALQESRLVLISAYNPSAGFNVGHAMQRNKSIYALSDAALVVNSDYNKGGTWMGAIEQLEKLFFVPIFVRNSADAGAGNAALIQHGAKSWPEPKSQDEFLDAVNRIAKESLPKIRQEQLDLIANETISTYSNTETSKCDNGNVAQNDFSNSPARCLLDAVYSILRDKLKEPKKPDEVARILDVSKVQASKWLNALKEEGRVEKIPGPVRFRVRKNINTK